MKGDVLMNKRLLVILSSFVIFSLISCNQPHLIPSKSSEQEETSIIDNKESPLDDKTSSEQPSSSIKEDTYYHVTFVNYDESVLYEVDVLEGNEALYSGEKPVKEEDDEFTYEFIGWDKELTNIQSDTTFIAQFEAVAKENWGPIIWF